MPRQRATPPNPGRAHQRAHASARIEAVLSLLRSRGGRVTIGRRAIATALVTAGHHHLTAADIAEVVQADHPDINVSTIYRNLEAFEHLGIVDRVNLGHGGAVYHPTDRAHHHLICEVCRNVIELDEEALAPLAAELDQRHQFSLSGRSVSLNGRCHACASATGQAGSN